MYTFGGTLIKSKVGGIGGRVHFLNPISRATFDSRDINMNHSTVIPRFWRFLGPSKIDIAKIEIAKIEVICM